MSNYGIRVGINIAFGMLGILWAAGYSSLLGSPNVSKGVADIGVGCWMVALTYIASYFFPVLRKWLFLPITLPICVAWIGYEAYREGVFANPDDLKAICHFGIIPAILTASPLAIASIKHQIWRHPWVRETFRYGDGVNAMWSTRPDFNRHVGRIPWTIFGGLGWLNGIYLGMTKFRHDFRPRHIVMREFCHLVTYGMSGSGKSICAAWPNYLLFAGAIWVADLKGEHVLAVGERRRKKGNVYCHDPLGVNKGRVESCRFNPLAEVDVTTEAGRSLIKEIAYAMVLDEHSSKHGSHFSESSRLLLQGIITFVCVTMPPELRNLVTVCRLINSQDPKTGEYDPDLWRNTLAEMGCCDVGVCSQAAKLIGDDVGIDEGGSFKSTLSRSIEFITSSEGMQHYLSGYDCSMKELMTHKRKKPSHFIVIGVGNEEKLLRYIRLMASVTLFHVRQEYHRTGKKAPKPGLLFGLDEFPLYSKNLPAFASTGIATLREINVRLWIQAQKRSMVKAVLGEDGVSLLEQNSCVQIWGVNNDDADVAAWVEAQLGKHMIRKRRGWGMFAKEVDRYEAPLMTRRAVQDTLGKHSPNQFVFPMDGCPMWITRLAFSRLRIEGKIRFASLGLGEFVGKTKG